MPNWGLSSLPHILVAIALLALCGVPTVDALGDHAQLHSFYPPILQHYWQNGFLFWSFGKQTVVTDQYVRLTENTAGSTGYLWNRHDNQMGSFQFNVTARMLDRDGAWFSSGDASHGMGIWYAVKSPNPLADTSFYGFEHSFNGFGVVLDHSNKLTLYVGNGGATDGQLPRGVAGCTVPSLKEKYITISITCDDTQQITVDFTKHDGTSGTEGIGNSKATMQCLKHQLGAAAQGASHHFGVTASNSASEQTIHDIHSIFMTPLSNVEEHELEEERVRNVHLFEGRRGGTDHTLDRDVDDADVDDEDEEGEVTTAPPAKLKRKRTVKRKKKASKE